MSTRRQSHALRRFGEQRSAGGGDLLERGPRPLPRWYARPRYRETLVALARRLVGQSDDGEGGYAVRHLYLPVDLQSIDALKSDCLDP